MKNFKWFKCALAITLILATMLSVVACVEKPTVEPPIDDDEETTTEATTTEEPVTTPNTPIGEAKFAIIVPEVLSAGENLTAAAEYLKKAIFETYGVSVEPVSDIKGKIEADTYTFLLGPTSFEQSAALSDDMKLDDYGYKVFNDKLVAIDAGAFDEVVTAVKKFCEDQMKYTEQSGATEAKYPSFENGKEFVHTGTYENKTVTINGMPIENFTIAIKNKSGIEAAEKLAEKLGKHNGYSVPIVLIKDLTGDEKAVICAGTLNREGSVLKSARMGYTYKVAVSNMGNKYTLGIAGSNDTNFTTALNQVLTKTRETESNGNVTVTLPQETTFKYTYTMQFSKAWTRGSTTAKSTIANGITYEERNFTSTAGAHIANILYVDTSLYTIRCGTPNESKSTQLSAGQTVTGQMAAAANKGYTVMAGTNGGIWVGSSVQSMSVKDGVQITKSSGTAPYIGLTKDGTLKIAVGTPASDFSNFSQVIGGERMLINDNNPQIFTATMAGFVTEHHPRTAAGLLDDGTLVLVTIDGRQSHSQGANLENLTDVMMLLGCKDAFVLDGGGSTTMAVKSGNSYVVKNSPSDGSQRAVWNSILVVKK